MVVARQPQARLLPLRREQGPRLLPAARSDQAPEHDRHRGLSEGRRANPIVDLFVYDVATKKTTKVDVRDGKPFNNDVVGHYVYHVAWSPDGRELLFNRTNRRQNVLELVAANPTTGALRVVIREEWPTGWIENSPTMVFLKDGQRFIWESERNGWTNFYLYDLSGKLIAPLTTHTTFEVGVHWSRSTRRRAWCSTRRATATTT